MNEIILPENGSVLIIDDQPKQALPIIQALSKKGISATYYRGVDDKELPENPAQSIRMAFVDLQLFQTDNDQHTIATRIVNILKKLIPANNGPYMLLIWSLKKHQYSQALKNEISQQTNGIVPVCILELEKDRCIKKKGVEFQQLDDFIENMQGDLSKSFNPEDVNSILQLIRNKWIIDLDAEYEVMPDAIDILEKNIKTELEKSGVFHLFIIWENLLKKSAVKTVADVASAIDSNEYWERNMQNLFYRLGRARVGQNKVMLSDSLLTFMQSYNDNVEAEIHSTSYPEYIKLESEDKFLVEENGSEYKLGTEHGNEAIFKNGKLLFSNGKPGRLRNTISDHKVEEERYILLRLLESYDKIPPKLNTSLHLELNPTDIHIPGNIYEIEFEEEKKQEYLSSTYYKSKRDNLSSFIFIELEISPICDYAQTKWKKSRLVSGLIYPANEEIRSKVGHFYEVEPEFLLNGKICKMVFDCHLFKALDHEIVKKRVIKYRLKRELLLDVVAKVSSHVNRPGISFVQ